MQSQGFSLKARNIYRLLFIVVVLVHGLKCSHLEEDDAEGEEVCLG